MQRTHVEDRNEKKRAKLELLIEYGISNFPIQLHFLSQYGTLRSPVLDGSFATMSLYQMCLHCPVPALPRLVRSPLSFFF